MSNTLTLREERLFAAYDVPILTGPEYPNDTVTGPVGRMPRPQAAESADTTAEPTSTPRNEATSVPTGAMIALVPTDADAARLAVDGGEPAAELHLTLAYLGKAADIPADIQARIVAAVESTVEDAIRPDFDLPAQADAFAVSMFNPGTEDACIVLGLSGDGLSSIRHIVVDTLGEVDGLDLPKQHPTFVPHVTLLYTDDTDRIAELVDRVGPVMFDRIRVAFAGEIVDILLGADASAAPTSLPGEMVMPSNVTDQSLLIDRESHRDEGEMSGQPRADYDPGQKRDEHGQWTDGMPEIIGTASVKLLGGDISIDAVARSDGDDGWIRISDGTHTANIGGSYATRLDRRMPDLREEMEVGETASVTQPERQDDGTYVSVPLYAVTRTGRSRYELKVANPDDTEESLTERPGVEMTYKQFKDVVDSAQMMSSARRIATDGGPVDFYPTGDSRMGVRVKDTHGDVREMSFGDKEWAKIARAVDVVWEGFDEDESPPAGAPDDWELTPVSEIQIPTSMGMLVVAHAEGRLTISPVASDDWHITWPADHRHPIWEAMGDVENAVGIDKFANNMARLLPIRAFTMPFGTDRGDRMGGRTAARAERTRMRVEAKRKWFRIQNTSAGTDIYLYGEIGCYGVTASDFVEELRHVTSPVINLHINSPGGDVFDGVAIYEALLNHPAKVNVSVDGLAASAASFIACVADPKRGEKIRIARFGQMMIHEAASGMYGTGKRLRKHADILDKTSEIISRIYAERAGGEPSVWLALMDEETWFDSAEAVQFGLADEISGEPANADADAGKAVPAKAVWDLSVFAYAGRNKAPAPTPALVMALTDEPASGDETPGSADPGEVDTTPVADPIDQTAEPEPQPESEQPADDPAPAITPTVTTQPSAWATPAWLDTPADPWQSLVAGLTTTEPSTVDGQHAPQPMEATQ